MSSAVFRFHILKSCCRPHSPTLLATFYPPCPTRIPKSRRVLVNFSLTVSRHQSKRLLHRRSNLFLRHWLLYSKILTLGHVIRLPIHFPRPRRWSPTALSHP